MNPQSEILSASESDLLIEHVRSANELSATALKILPVLLILSVLCWVYDWYAILKFIFTVTSVALVVGLVVIYFKNRQINRDLRNNRKRVEVFFLTRKFIEGYVKGAGESGSRSTGQAKRWARSIILADESIRHAIAYKQKIKTADKLQRMMTQSDIDDAVLSYTYKYKLKDRKGKEHEMEIPIELYLNGEEGAEVEIAYSPHSKIVLQVRDIR